MHTSLLQLIVMALNAQMTKITYGPCLQFLIMCPMFSILLAGPLFYKGWYHIFYQYNPESAVWGNIAWGHAVSEDMIHWLHLPSAMEPDNWFDANGVWTGSATILPDGQIVMLYTGSTDKNVQVCRDSRKISSDSIIQKPLSTH